jgi:hypothetical protein
MIDYLKLALLGAIAVLAAIAANFARDLAYQIHALVILAVAGGLFVWQLRRTDEPRALPDTGYMDGPIRAGVIATAFWGVAGFLVGTFIAFQLAYPALNFEWAQGYANFGRLRPLHTSAVIFAFGGNALIASSFYVVQRTSAARLWGGNLAWFVFWGYQLFIVLAATGYLLGATQSKEYAEPEWYVDLWLTIVWVAYLAVFLGTILIRKERHIYVANWFYLSFIVTIAMLHIVNNLSLPVSLVGSKSVQVFAGVQDAMTQWWYGHNAVGFFLTAGFLAMMYYAVGRLGQAAHRPGAADDGDLDRLLRDVDLRGADDVDPRRQQPEPLHRLDHRPRPLRRAGLERHDHLRRPLLPGAEAVEPRAAVFAGGGQLALLARDHRHRPLRGVDVGDGDHGGADVARGRRQRLPGEQLRRHRGRQVPDVRGAGAGRGDVPERRADHVLEPVDDRPRRARPGRRRGPGRIRSTQEWPSSKSTRCSSATRRCC